MSSFILRNCQLCLKAGTLGLFFALCCAYGPAQAQTTRYVSPGGSGAKDGSSWANASDDLQAMINASASGDQVFVTAGTFKPNRKANALETITPNDRDNAFVLTNGVKVYGGFSGNEASLSNRNLSAGYISILSGDFDGDDEITGSGSTLTISNNSENAYHVVISASDAGNSVLDGFTITGGKCSAEGEGAIQIGISNISRNYGGGIHISGSSPGIRNCIITGNDAGMGGGVYVSTGSSPSFANSVFSKNMAGGTGGGGLYNTGGSGSTTTVTNCTFWGNTVSGNNGGAISLLAPGSVVLRNSIVYGNKSGINSGPATVSYSLVQGSSSTSNGNINGNTDPLFVNAPGGDFRLQMTSPAINKGNNALIPADVTTDITGNDRITDCIVDMGAYENALLPSVSDQAFCGSGTVAGLVATGQNLKWYSGAGGGSPLDEATALSTGTYYVSQTIDGCESPRKAVSVTIYDIPVAPSVEPSQDFCDGETVAGLQADGDNLQWYNVAEDGTPLAPETALINGTYYVSQTVNGCESPRMAVSVTVYDIPAAPDASAQTFCPGETVAVLQATGENLQWYDVAEDGTPLTLDAVLAEGTYYVSQTIDGCQSPRTTVSLSYRVAVPAASSPQNVASGAMVYSLAADGQNLKWYNVSAGGTALSLSAVVSAGTYYVSQTVDGCESLRTAVTVTTTSLSIRYVKPSASGLGDGSSWENASDDLQAMINASSSGNSIFVAAGTYKPNRKANATGTITPNDRDNAFVLKNGVKIYGGFAGTESSLSERNLGAGHTSILSGDFSGNDGVSGSGGSLTISNNGENAYRVVISAGSIGSAVLDGFTVKGGNASTGGSNITVNGQSVGAGRGGGLHITNSSPVISNCVFTGNYAVAYGGGLHVGSGSSPAIINNIFNKNHSSTAGGGMANFASPTVTNCTFWGNRDNGSNSSGGIFNSAGTLTLRNSIIYGNNSGIGVGGGSITRTYSLVQGQTSTANGNINGSTNPLFVNASGGDFRLQTLSPAANAGNNGHVPSGISTDIAGNARIFDCAVDMGAYEQTTLTPAPGASAQTFCAGETVAELTGTGQNLKWYDAAEGGTALVLETGLVSGTYYVSQTVNGCESTRTAVNVTVRDLPEAPEAEASQYFCTGETVAGLEAEGDNLQWYNVAEDGTPLAPETALVSGTYYVSQTVNGCESPRAAFNVIISTPAAGNLTFTTQQQVDDFGTMNPCDDISVDNLTIGYESGSTLTDITDLSPLQRIVSVSGNVIIRNNPGLTSLSGLDALQSIGGNLNIQINENLTNIQGLSSLESITGYFYLYTNARLTNLDGLSSLTYIGGYLYIHNNDLLQNLNGLSSLSGLGGYLDIRGNTALTNITGLGSLTGIGGALVIRNTGLTHLTGLGSLQNIGGALWIFGNSQLQNLNALSSLTTIGGAIDIDQNTVLTDISGLQNINPATITGVTGLRIANNPVLSVCNLPNFCTYLANPVGTHPRGIGNNATDCISVAAVTATCAEPVAGSPQYFCAGKTVADLVATGQNLKWYSTEESDTPLMETTLLTSGTYYVSQTIGGFESPRTAVSVTVYEIFTLTAEALLTHPSPDSLTAGVLTFTTSGADGSALLSYEKDGTPQTPVSVTISSGKFTLSDLTVGVYSDFLLTEPVTGCPVTGSASVTLYDRPGIPDVTVTGITSVKADIKADINAGDANTSAAIVYGTDPALVSGTQSVTLATDVTPAESPAEKQAEITGLTANTTYYYKIILTNAYGSVETATGNFTTLSDEAALSSLIPDKGTLSPAFSSETFSYDMTVSNAEEKIRFTPTASSPLASISINGDPVSSGTSSGDIALSPGSNTVTITVTAEDPDVKQTYTVNVYRKQLQTITFPALADAVFGGVPPVPAATADSDLPVSYSSSDPDIAEIYQDTEDGNKWKITIKKAGTITITASQAGDEQYEPAEDKQQELKILKAAITGITFANDSFEFDGTEKELLITGTLPEGASVSYENNGKINVGVYEVIAYISGGNNYLNDTLYAELEITPVTIAFSLKDQNTHPITCSGAEGSIAFSSNLPAGTYLLDYTLDENPEQKEVEVLTGGEFTLTGLTAGVYSDFSINMPAVGAGSASGTVTLSDPEAASLAIDSFDHPTTSSTNGSIKFTTTLADGNYTLNYSRALESQTRSVTVSSGEFTLTGLNASMYSGITYSGFSITDPVLECEAVASESVTLGNRPTFVTVSNGAHEPTGTIYVRTANSAYVRAVVRSGSSPASVQLFYGTDPELSTGVTTTYLSSPGAGIEVGYIPQITGLTQNTTYYFKFRIINDYGTAESSIRSFRTRSTNANLTALVPGKGSLSPSFSSGTTNYTVTLASTETGITFTPTAAAYATIRINGTAINSGTESAEIPLDPGNNTVTFRVDAEAGNTNTYTVNVIRKQTQTITFPSPGDLVYGDPNPLLNATASSGLAVTYSTSDNSIAHDYSDGGSIRKLNIRKAGTVTITASQTGNGTYEAAENVELVLTILPASVAGVSFNDASFVYDGTEKELLITGELPEATSVEYTLNRRTLVGEQEATALIAGESYDTLRLTARLKIDPLNMVFSVKENTPPGTCSGTDGSITFESNLPAGLYPLDYTHDGNPVEKVINVTTGGEFTLTGLVAGIYKDFSITTDTAGAGVTSEIVTLNDPAIPVLTPGTVTGPSICKGIDGSIAFSTNLVNGTYTLNFKKGTKDTTAQVSVSANAFTLTGLTAGGYSDFLITVSGCTGTASGSITLTEPTAPTLTLGESVNPSTCEGTDGSISFSTNLVNGTYSLNFKKGTEDTTTQVSVNANAFTLTTLAAGTYSNFSITVSGCTGATTGSITLVEPNAPTLALGESVNPTTCEGTDGSIDFSTNLTNGTYSLNFKKGTKDTSAQVSVNANAFTLNGLAAGIYTDFSITVSACTGSASGSITLSDLTAPTLTLGETVNPATCEGTNGSIAFSTNLPDGTYTLSYIKGTTPLTAEISVALGKFSLDSLAAGTYFGFAVTVSACTGTASGSITLTEPATPTLTVEETVNPTTCEGTNGSIAFSTNLPNGTYTLNYSKGATSVNTDITVASGEFTLSGLSAGIYSIFSITINGCTGSVSGPVTLYDPAAPTLTLGDSFNPTICEGADGSITFFTSLDDEGYILNYSRGTTPLTAEIEIVSGKFTLAGLTEGTYSAFSLFVNGCMGLVDGTVTLTDPEAPTLTLEDLVNPTVCSGTDGNIAFSTNLTNGTYSLNFKKGTKDTSAQVSVNSNVFTLTGLTAGTYTDFSITVSACTGNASGSTTLTEPAAPMLTVGESVNPTTCEGTDGSIDFSTNLTNGTYSLNFKKGTKDTTAQVSINANIFTLNGLTAGTYTDFSITVSACTGTASGSITLSDLTAPTLTLGETLNPTTCEGTDGSIAFSTNLPDGTYTLSYIKGTTPLTVEISVALGKFNLASLAAGTYFGFAVTISGCTGTASGSVTLSEPTAPTLTAGETVNPTTCEGTNGSIAFSTNLTNGTYTLNFKKGTKDTTAQVTVSANAFTLTGLTAGSYSAFSIIVSGCTATTSGAVTLSEPTAPTLALGEIVNPTTCEGTNGSIAFSTNLTNGTYTLNFKKGTKDTTAQVTVSANAFTLTGLTAGSYSAFSIIVSGCTATTSGAVTLSEPTAPTLALGEIVNPMTCEGTNGSIAFSTNLVNGTYILNFKKGTKDTTALVTVSTNAFSLTALAAGNYSAFSITVSGCTAIATESVTLSEPTAPTLTAGVPVNPTTCEGTDGSIAFSINLVNGTYSLNFKKGSKDTTALVTISANAFALTTLAAGTYSDFSITVSGCTVTASGSVTLTEPTAPTLALGETVNPTTCEGTNGSIAFSTNLTNGIYTLNFKKGTKDTTALVTVSTNAFSLTALAAGNYSDFSITVNGCTGNTSGSITLAEPTAPTLTVGESVNPTTCEGTDGSIAFSTNLVNGTYALNFKKGSKDTTALVTVNANAFSLTALAAGNYSDFFITVNGCTGNTSGSITLAEPTSPTLTVGETVSPTTCEGTDGSIAFSTNLTNGIYSLSFKKGTKDTTAQISVNTNTFTLTGLTASTYSGFSITVSGCIATTSGSVTLSEPTAPTLTVGETVNPTTCEGTDGSIAFSTNLVNGTYFLNFKKGSKDTTAQVTVNANAFTLIGLAAGSYSGFSVTVSGCTTIATGSVTLSEPTAPTLTAGEKVNPTTCEGTDGSIAFSTNLTNGTYTLNFKKGSKDTTAQVTVSANAFTITGLTAGTYTAFSITVSGCSAIAIGSVTLSEPTAPTLALGETVNPTTCEGTNGSIAFSTNLVNGTYTLNFKKGTKDTTAQVSVSTNTFTLTGLTASTYSGFSITVSGCIATTSGSVMLSEPTAPTLTVGETVNPTTCEGTDGSIAFSTNLVNGTYALNFKKGTKDTTAQVSVNDNAFTLTGLTAGTYSGLSITVNACTGNASGSITLAEPVAPTLTVGETVNPTTCEGTNGSIAFSTNLVNGTYTLNFKKGTKDTTTQVSVNSNVFTLTGLTAGTYSGFSVTVSGCTATASGSVTLSEPTAPTLALGETVNPTTCEGTNGSIAFSTNLVNRTYTLNFKKGTKDTTAQVTVNANAFSLTALAAGNYSDFFITVNGCTGNTSGSITLAEPTSPTLTVGETVNPTTCEGINGSIAFSTNLINGTYTLNLKKGTKDTTAQVTVNANAFSLTALAAGNYSDFFITVNGCTGNTSGSITLAEPTSPTLTVGETVNPTTCEGINGSIAFSTNLTNGTYTLNLKKGTKDTTAQVTVNANAFTLTGLTAETYSAFSVTISGCTATTTGSITLAEPTASTLTLGVPMNPTTCEGTNGSIPFTTNLTNGTYTLNFKKGTKDTMAQVSVNANTFTLTELTAGTYTAFSITVNGCTATAPGIATLTEPVAPTIATGTVTQPVICGGAGSIRFNTTGLAAGTHTLTFKKDSKDTTTQVTVSSNAFTLSGLHAGVYSAFGISTTGCKFILESSITLINPAALVATITPDGPTELCEDKKVTLTATQASAYLWSTGDTTRSITVDKGGLYSVKITSAQGCSSQAQITVTQKICNVPPMAVCKPHVVLVANDNCYATLRPEDLDAGSYDENDDWFNRSIDIHPDLSTGTYTVTFTVIDIRGATTSCQSRVDVVDHTPPVALARALTLPLDQNGNASISVSDIDAGSKDNCGPVTLSLSRTHFSCNDLGQHRVTLTVTDASGNTSSAQVDITVVDNIPPTVKTKAVTLQLDQNGQATVAPADLAEVISDNCGIWDVRLSQTQFSCEHIGLNRVVLTVEDVQGGTTSDTVLVTVVDNTPPVITAHPVTLYLDEAGKAQLDHTFIGLSVTDNCAVDSVQLSRISFSCDDLGEHNILITAVDVNGNATEATVTITVTDTLAPVVKTRDVALYLDAAGQATLTPGLADDGSSDNCEIVSRELQRTAFDCADTGQHTITYTLTDAAGNQASATLLVTVHDTLRPLARTQNVILELSEAGTVSLTPEEVDNLSADNCAIASMTLSQTLFTCADLGSRLITLTVTDVNGNQASEKADVLIRDPLGICPCSYGVLATDRIVLRGNEVSAGGIGVTSSGGKVKLRNTVVNQEGTFVKAPHTRFDSESESSTYFRGQAPQPEAFRKNSGKDKGKEKVGKGESKTLAAGRYGKVRVMKDATLSFSGGEVYIRSLKVKKNAKISFADPTVLLVRDQVRLARATEFNGHGETVRLYAGKRVTIGNGSEIQGYLHSQSRLKTGGGSKETRMEGFFAAESIKGGRNTQWAGGGVLCRENEQQQSTTKAKRNMIAEEESQPATEAAPEIRVSLSPNPASEKAQAEIFLPSGKGELILTDILGNVLIRKAISTAQSVHHLDIKGYTPGIYIIRINDGKQVKTVRLVKENL